MCLLHQNKGWGWRLKTGLSPPVKYFTDRSKAVLLLWIFYVFVLSCVCYVLCASVYMCFVVTCWERADLLALVCGVFCEFVTFPLVSWVRCGTWLYRFLIFATLLTFARMVALFAGLLSYLPWMNFIEGSLIVHSITLISFEIFWWYSVYMYIRSRWCVMCNKGCLPLLAFWVISLECTL